MGACGCFLCSLCPLCLHQNERRLDVSVESLFEESKKFSISKKTGGTGKAKKQKRNSFERKFCVRTRRMSHYPK